MAIAMHSVEIDWAVCLYMYYVCLSSSYVCNSHLYGLPKVGVQSDLRVGYPLSPSCHLVHAVCSSGWRVNQGLRICTCYYVCGTLLLMHPLTPSCRRVHAVFPMRWEWCCRLALTSRYYLAKGLALPLLGSEQGQHCQTLRFAKHCLSTKRARSRLPTRSVLSLGSRGMLFRMLGQSGSSRM